MLSCHSQVSLRNYSFSCRKKQLFSRNFATTHLTAFILPCHLPVASQPMKFTIPRAPFLQESKVPLFGVGLHIFGVPETSGFTKPPRSYEFCSFSFRRTRKEPRSSARFWAATGPVGFSKQLFGSSREGIKLDWTCFKQFLLANAKKFRFRKTSRRRCRVILFF